MVELRWLRYSGTTTTPDRLQWREIEEDSQGVILSRNWSDVPIILTEEQER